MRTSMANKLRCRLGKHEWTSRGRGDALTYLCRVCGKTSDSREEEKGNRSQCRLGQALSQACSAPGPAVGRRGGRLARALGGNAFTAALPTSWQREFIRDAAPSLRT